MGVSSSKKLAAKCSFLTKDEQLIVSNSFKFTSKNSEKIKEEELTVRTNTFKCDELLKNIFFRNYGAHKWIPDFYSI